MVKQGMHSCDKSLTWLFWLQQRALPLQGQWPEQPGLRPSARPGCVLSSTGCCNGTVTSDRGHRFDVWSLRPQHILEETANVQTSKQQPAQNETPFYRIHIAEDTTQICTEGKTGTSLCVINLTTNQVLLNPLSPACLSLPAVFSPGRAVIGEAKEWLSLCVVSITMCPCRSCDPPGCFTSAPIQGLSPES